MGGMYHSQMVGLWRWVCLCFPHGWALWRPRRLPVPNGHGLWSHCVGILLIERYRRFVCCFQLQVAKLHGFHVIYATTKTTCQLVIIFINFCHSAINISFCSYFVFFFFPDHLDILSRPPPRGWNPHLKPDPILAWRPKAEKIGEFNVIYIYITVLYRSTSVAIYIYIHSQIYIYIYIHSQIYIYIYVKYIYIYMYIKNIHYIMCTHICIYVH